MEQREHLQTPKNWHKKLQYLLTAAALSLMLNLWLPNTTVAQDKKNVNKEMSKEQKKDSLEKKEIINEWSEINNLKNCFKDWHYGSDHLISLLWGRFVGEHGKNAVNGRSLTSAYDYLILDNTMMALLVNLGFTEKNIKFISTKKLPHRQPYKLWYTVYKENKEENPATDSAYSHVYKRNVAIKKNIVTHYNRIIADSSKTSEVNLGWVKYKYPKEKGKPRSYNFVEMPQIQKPAEWTDANNFDLAYETMEYFFNQNKYFYDISKRQFSSTFPAALKEYVIANFDKDKVLREKKARGESTAIVYRDTILLDNNTYHNPDYLLDIVNQPNHKIFTFGNYAFFRYFTDIYRRDTRYDEQGVNPLWHNAFQNDNDREKHKDGLIYFITLPYGTKEYIMPTLVPKNEPPYTTQDGFISSSDISDQRSGSMTITNLNGRIINQNRFEIHPDKWLFTLPGQGVVDRLYGVYSTSDHIPSWMFDYCGVQSGIRWWSLGKLLADKAIELKNQLVNRDNWKFCENRPFSSFLQYKDEYIKKIESHTKWPDKLDRKTIFNLIIPTKIPNPKNPQKKKNVIKRLEFRDDKTAVLYPDTLIIPYTITHDYQNRWTKQRYVNNVHLNFLWTNILLDSLPGVISGNMISPEIIQENNETYTTKIAQTNTPAPASTKVQKKPEINEVYNNHIYNLSDINDNEMLIEEINNNIIDIDYNIKETGKNIVIQKEKKIKKIQGAMQELEEQNKTETRWYTNLKKDFEEANVQLQEMEEQYMDAKKQRAKLYKLQQKYYMTAIDALQYLADGYTDIITYLEHQIATTTEEMKSLASDDEVYKFKARTIANNTERINEEKKKKEEALLKIEQLKKEKQTKQLQIIDEKEIQSD